MSDPTSNFEDPSLKQAVRTVAGSHRASAALRARVAQTLASADVAGTPHGKPADADRQPMRIGHSQTRRLLTMAAAIVIGIGVSYEAYYFYDQYRESRATYVHSDAYAISDSTLDAMLRAHAIGAKLDTSGAPDHDVRALQAPATDPKALASEASVALNRPVPSPTLSGWTLDRAAVTDVAGFQAARFHFTKGKQSATLLSLPVEAWPYRSSDHYCTQAHDQQSIAGFVAGPSLNCIIGDPSLSTADVEALVTSLRNQ